jgi:hypothetical protein
VNTLTTRASKFFLAAALSLLVLVFVLPFPSLAQDFDRVVSGVPFEHDGEPLVFTFFGGVDFFLPQFVDIDGDGDLDLFVLKPFLTAQNRLLEGRLAFFENTGDAQFHRLQFLTNFYHDLDVHNWFSFLDLDADGDLDLVHDNGAGGLTWRRNIGTRERADFILAEATILDRNGQRVANEFSSIPAFADIDGDNDYDFFTGLSLGTIVHYRNVGTPFSPLFAFETNKWQDLLILSIGASTPKSPVHGSNVIAFNDIDNDGDLDFFYGDFFHKSLYHLRNDGDAREAKIAITDSLWPRPRPVLTRGYNAPRFADLDADGHDELFIAAWNQSQKNFLFYASEEAGAERHYRLLSENFLSTFDAGSYSTPALADLDADGDLDLTLGTFDGDLLFFENFGAATAPAFRDAPNKFPNLRITGYVTAPTLVDIDNDGDFDLFTGGYTGNILFFENRGSSQAPAFTLNTQPLGIANTGLYSAPCFADLDRDGDFDLAVGVVTNGMITFFENVGNATSPSFMLKSQFQPEAGTTDAKPFLYDWDRDGNFDLFIGQRNGRVLYYRGISSQFGDQFVLAEREFAGLRVGALSAPAFGDLNGDGKVDILLGEEAGGLNYFLGRTNAAVAESPSAPRSFTLAVHPNPFRDELRITIHGAFGDKIVAPRLTLYNLVGAKITELFLPEENRGVWSVQWRASQTPLRSGIYFLRARWGSLQAVQKVLLVR